MIYALQSLVESVSTVGWEADYEMILSDLYSRLGIEQGEKTFKHMESIIFSQSKCCGHMQGVT